MPRARKSQGHVGIRRVRTKEDRKRPSVFMRLKTDEAFKGVALFEPDPELDDNPGYFEYYDHYDKQANQYVPCAGDRCPFCAANDNPSTRALTVWYFPQAADVKDRIKVFTMNYSTINEISDEAEDEDGLVGKVVRIKRLSDKGDYRVKVTSDKALTKAELKEAQKLLDEKFPEVEVDGETVSGLEALVLRQLKIQLERLKAVEALDDDDDDDEEEAPRSTSRKGKPAKAETTEAEDDDEDEEDEDEEEAEEEAEAPAAISDETFDILSVRKRDGYIVVEHDGEEVKLYASDDAGIDDFKKGDSVTASADWTEEDDEEGYWLLTEIAEAESDEDESDEEDDDSEDDSE